MVNKPTITTTTAVGGSVSSSTALPGSVATSGSVSGSSGTTDCPPVYRETVAGDVRILVSGEERILV